MAHNKPTILILLADVGFGHRSASNAIVDALEEQYGDQYEVAVANPFDEPSVPAVIRQAQSDHTRLVRELPQVYTLGLRVTDSDLTKGLGSVAGLLILSEAITDLLERHQPAVVVVTHPIATEPLLSYRRTNEKAFPIVTVITDLTRLHRLWFNEEVDLCLLPTRAAVGLAVERGMPVDHLLVTGIPIHPRFTKVPKDRAALRRRLGLEPDRLTVLVVGSARVSDLEHYAAALNGSGLPIQLITVAGGDDALFARLEAVPWAIPTARFNFVEDMPEVMHAADCILTKAGGLVVSESLGCGLPMIITQCNPVHEKGNAEFVVLQGAGEMAETPEDAVAVVGHWLENDGELFGQRSAYAERLGRPRAAYTIAEIIHLLAEGHGPTSDVFIPYRQMD
jgi:UDP-N-acetylglucosamine:LPS N-acetylglucosamine transferase